MGGETRTRCAPRAPTHTHTHTHIHTPMFFLVLFINTRPALQSELRDAERPLVFIIDGLDEAAAGAGGAGGARGGGVNPLLSLVVNHLAKLPKVGLCVRGGVGWGAPNQPQHKHTHHYTHNRTPYAHILSLPPPPAHATPPAPHTHTTQITTATLPQAIRFVIFSRPEPDVVARLDTAFGSGSAGGGAAGGGGGGCHVLAQYARAHMEDLGLLTDADMRFKLASPSLAAEGEGEAGPDHTEPNPMQGRKGKTESLSLRGRGPGAGAR